MRTILAAAVVALATTTVPASAGGDYSHLTTEEFHAVVGAVLQEVRNRSSCAMADKRRIVMFQAVVVPHDPNVSDAPPAVSYNGVCGLRLVGSRDVTYLAQ